MDRSARLKMRRQARNFSGVIALLAFVSIVAQGYVFALIIAEKGGNASHVVWVMLSFFTILTNLAIVAVCTAIAVGKWPGWWPEIASTLGCLTVNIGLVSVVYHALLSNLWNPQGLHFLSDQGLHTLVPLLFLVFWVLEAPKDQLSFDHAIGWLLYPLAYFIYALARGAVDGWYPYPFIDVAKLGYGRVALNAAAIAVPLTVGGFVLVHVARKMTGRANET